MAFFYLAAAYNKKVVYYCLFILDHDFSLNCFPYEKDPDLDVQEARKNVFISK